MSSISLGHLCASLNTSRILTIVCEPNKKGDRDKESSVYVHSAYKHLQGSTTVELRFIRQ